MTVSALMRLQKRVLQPRGRGERAAIWHRYGQLEILTDVAHVDGDLPSIHRAGIAFARMPLFGRSNQASGRGRHRCQVPVERHTTGCDEAFLELCGRDSLST